MFKIDDYVIYGSNGVCKIKDIKKIKMNNKESEYYVLSPVNKDKMTIKIPVDNTNILMRSLMSKKEVMDLIDMISKNEILEVEDDRKKNQEYKAVVKEGNVEEIIKVINSIKLDEKERASLGKKINKTEEDILVKAKKQLYEEIGIVLGISEDKVEEYIKKNI